MSKNQHTLIGLLACLGLTLTPVVSGGAELSSADNHALHRGKANIAGALSADERFGTSLAVGDFDGDGRSDLAIGSPREDGPGLSDLGSVATGEPTVYQNAGAVHIVYGAPQIGLKNIQSSHIQRKDTTSTVEDHDNLGTVLAAGDFDGNGASDLAIGIPYDDVQNNSITNAGSVVILYGGDNDEGVTKDSQQQTFRQGLHGLSGVPEPNDRFGAALAVGDFNCDKVDDLAIGTPYETIGSNSTAKTHAGMVHILYGKDGVGLTGQGSKKLLGKEESARFGFSLAAGNFSDADYGNFCLRNLAVGIPGKNDDAGGVDIYNNYWFQRTITQDSPGMKGVAESGDEFGYSLAVGDGDVSCQFDGDCRMDLFVGAPGENQDSGVIHFIPGTCVGITQDSTKILECPGQNSVEQDQIIYQSDSPLASAESGDRFGTILGSVLTLKDGINDWDGNFGVIAVGAPFEDINNNTVNNGGAVTVLYPITNDPNEVNSFSTIQQWTQGGGKTWNADNGNVVNEGDIAGGREPNDRFGSTLAFGDFDGDLQPDLAIGVPYEEVSGRNQAGSVNILYGRSN